MNAPLHNWLILVMFYVYLFLIYILMYATISINHVVLTETINTYI